MWPYTLNRSAADQTFDAVVIGAGQAGLGTSYFLKQHGVAHVVLEKGNVGETWRSQRWDSFALNSPNALNGLPGVPYEGPQPDGFYTADELIQTFEDYVHRFSLPVRTGVTVTAVEPHPAGAGYLVHTETADKRSSMLHTRAVVVASGILREPKFPAAADKLAPRFVQLHSADYRSPAGLTDGAVVVVGSGQSGCQIAEELIQAGHRVYLATSKVGRLPRRYRGRDAMAWLWDSGFLDVARDDLADPRITRAAQPQVSGIGRYGHTLSLQKLAREGVRLRGRVLDADAQTLTLGADLKDNIRFADQKSAEFKREIEAFITRYGIEAPAAEFDPADQPWTDLDDMDAPTRFDLAAEGVGTIIWRTGFTPHFPWLHVPVLDEQGHPLHDGG